MSYAPRVGCAEQSHSPRARVLRRLAHLRLAAGMPPKRNPTMRRSSKNIQNKPAALSAFAEMSASGAKATNAAT